MTTPAEMRKMMSMATGGPWDTGIASDTRVCVRDQGSCITICRHTAVSGQAIANRDLIVAMRNHLPALLELWEAVAHEHDLRFREIASENHDNCPICNIIKRLEAGRG